MLTAAGLRTGSAAAGREGSAPTLIRPVDRQDLPAVARLFEETFLSRDPAGSAPLASYLGEALFEHPWRDPGLSSLVSVDEGGRVGGFIAVFPLKLLVNGAPVRGALAGTLMVERPADNPFAGARLLRSFLNGPQDISLSESANETSRGMWEKLGGETAMLYSMEWLRVFRPAGFALAVGERRSAAAKLLRPLARGFDALAGRVRANPLRLAPGHSVGVEAGIDDLIDLIPRFASSYAMRPDWERTSLTAFLTHAATKERHGALFRRVVCGSDGAPVGVYLYYGQPRGIGFVLQILARPGAGEAVVDDLLADAMGRGLVALRGRVQPELAGILLRRRAVFLHAASTLMHSRHQELLAPIRTGDALITGLAGETWSRLIGGRFIHQD